MASQTQGIQQLLAAEKKAAEKVSKFENWVFCVWFAYGEPRDARAVTRRIVTNAEYWFDLFRRIDSIDLERIWDKFVADLMPTWC